MFSVASPQPKKIEPNEQDIEIYQMKFYMAFDQSPKLRSGMPSMMTEIMKILLTRNSNNKPIFSPRERFEGKNRNERMTPLEFHVNEMACLIKYEHSNLGSKEPVLSEEIKGALDFAKGPEYKQLSSLI